MSMPESQGFSRRISPNTARRDSGCRARGSGVPQKLPVAVQDADCKNYPLVRLTQLFGFQGSGFGPRITRLFASRNCLGFRVQGLGQGLPADSPYAMVLAVHYVHGPVTAAANPRRAIEHALPQTSVLESSFAGAPAHRVQVVLAADWRLLVHARETTHTVCRHAVVSYVSIKQGQSLVSVPPSPSIHISCYLYPCIYLYMHIVEPKLEEEEEEEGDLHRGVEG